MSSLLTILLAGAMLHGGGLYDPHFMPHAVRRREDRAIRKGAHKRYRRALKRGSKKAERGQQYRYCEHRAYMKRVVMRREKNARTNAEKRRLRARSR